MNTSANVSSTNQPASLLRIALKGNATFSIASGVVLVMAAPALARIMGIPWPLALTVTGVILLPFGLLLWRLAATQELAPTVGWIAVVLDVLWVVGSVALLLGGWLPLTAAGKWIVALLAEAVGLFAILEYLGVRRLTVAR